MTVGQIMTALPKVLGLENTIQKTAKMMRDHDYGVIPLVDGDSALVGIVTDRDITKSQTPAAETLKTLKSVSASGGENRPGAGLPES